MELSAIVFITFLLIWGYPSPGHWVSSKLSFFAPSSPVFLQLLLFLSIFLKHAGKLLGSVKLPLDVNKSECV